MTANHDEIIKALEAAWQAMRRATPDLPEVAIMAGGFRPPTIDPETSPPDVFLSTQTLSCGPVAALSALGHDAAHLLAEARGLNDTSDRGRYHNGVFADLAGELGFREVETDTPARWGTADLRPVDHRLALRRLARVLPADSPHASLPFCRTRRVSRPSTNNAKATCLCSPSRIIYVARGTLDLGQIVCGKCESTFEIRDANLVNWISS